MKTNNPKISIIIPVKNGSKTMESCLKGIFSQTLKDLLEVVIVDSGSTDGTLDSIKQFPIRLFQISPEEFNHGLTRNYGVSKAKGEFVVLTVQDAIPATNDWLEIMYKHFQDTKIMGVCGQQIVSHDPAINPLEWFRPLSEPVPRFVEFSPGEFEKLDGKTQHKYCGWDDVNAMYRKSALSAIPFKKTNFGEDALWAKEALNKGCVLVYNYNARVQHYHHNTFNFTFKRAYTVQYHTMLYFNYVRKYENFFIRLIKIVYRIFFKKQARTRKIYWTVYNLKQLIAHYSATLLFRISFLFLSTSKQERMHKFWVGKPPQAKSI